MSLSLIYQNWKYIELIRGTQLLIRIFKGVFGFFEIKFIDLYEHAQIPSQYFLSFDSSSSWLDSSLDISYVINIWLSSSDS